MDGDQLLNQKSIDVVTFLKILPQALDFMMLNNKLYQKKK
jgi:hypothetical protein